MVSPADRSPLPLYYQLYERLEREVRRGVYPSGGPFPSEPELCKRFGVSRATVRAALGLLEQSGLILRRQGRRTICTYDVPNSQAAPALHGFVENLIAMGLQTEVRVLGSQFLPAGDDIGRSLGVDAGDEVHFSQRVRSYQGSPFSLLTTHVPAAVARSCDLTRLGDVPLLVLLEDSGHLIREAEQWISATAATPEAAQNLEVAEGSPLISLTRVVYDDGKRAIEHLHALYRPDRYSFALSLERERGVDAARWRARG